MESWFPWKGQRGSSCWIRPGNLTVLSQISTLHIQLYAVPAVPTPLPRAAAVTETAARACAQNFTRVSHPFVSKHLCSLLAPEELDRRGLKTPAVRSRSQPARRFRVEKRCFLGLTFVLSAFSCSFFFFNAGVLREPLQRSYQAENICAAAVLQTIGLNGRLNLDL